MSRMKVLISVIFFTALGIILIMILKSNHNYNKLIVNESEWNSIKESRIENKNLVLEDIKFNDYKLIIDEKNNTLYYSIINDSGNKYKPNISYKSSAPNVKLIVLSDEITDEKIKNNHQFKIMIYNEKEYHVYNLKCLYLPILNISYNKDEESKQNNIPMEMYIFDNLSNIPNRITISSGKIRINENNYTISLHMLTPGKNKRDNKISILNMKPNSEYILAPINNDTENTENANHRIEFFLNNEYKGVYFLEYIDKINKNDSTKVKPKYFNK